MIKFYLKYIRPVYRFIIPVKLRKRIEYILFGVSKPKLRKKIIKYLKNIPSYKVTTEELEVLNFLEKNELQIFPYEYTKKFKDEDHEVFLDKKTQLHYVLYEGEKLFFKRSWTTDRIKTILNNLLIEQYPLSPHRYLTDNFKVDKDSTIIDIGVADGNFALSVIKQVKKVYLFESDPEWIEALNATFEPWKEKVVIINKWVSDVNDDTFVTLDTYFKDIKIDFIKIDVDGFERKLLNGGKELISKNKGLKIALCTYHNQDDAKEFNSFFKEQGFETEFSYGYMLFYWGEIKPPYLRRGLIRATKK